MASEGRILQGIDVGGWGLTTWRVFDDGRVAVVLPGIFAYLLCVSSPDSWRLGCRDDVFTYTHAALAQAALEEWDGAGEPDGWIRHQPSNRRRPDGDASREFVRA